MGLTKLSIIVKSLRKSGWPRETPVMIIANGTKPQEQMIKGTLSTIKNLVKKQELRPPALIIVGKIIEFYKPDLRKTFLHCGTHPKIYEYLGRILSWPMIDIKPVVLNEAQQKHLLRSFETADIIICTSCYAVESFFHVLARIEGNQTLKVQLKDKLFAVIGRLTQKALQVHHIQAAIVAEEETAQGLLKAITQHMKIEGKRILFPRSNLPNPFLKEALKGQGALVTEVTIYENTKTPTRDLPSVNIDGVIFTSPSTVQNFLTDYGTIPNSWKILAKGPVTLKTLQEAGYHHAASLS